MEDDSTDRNDTASLSSGHCAEAQHQPRVVRGAGPRCACGKARRALVLQGRAAFGQLEGQLAGT